MRGRLWGGAISGLVATLALAAGVGAGVQPAAGAALPIAQGRAADPIVITGAKVPTLNGVPVGDIVAFRWAKRWVHIPVQVDQRKPVELNTVYGQPANTTNPVKVLVYADPKTFTGPGTGKLAGIDEIAFMAHDIGTAKPPSFSVPAGVVKGSGVRITATDRITHAKGYVFLFRRSGTKLKPGAGKQYVKYSFHLLSGAYKTTYNTAAGPNPENTSVSTASYSRHFGDRWLDDNLAVKAGNSTGVDIVDRHKAMFAPGNCGRSEDTFDSGEGAFIANISGPVRAIRSYIGANSGPYTERTHVFYDRREDITTDLRVHPIPSIMNFWDYSPAAAGMRYSNDRNPAGVIIDGAPDTVASGANQWSKVDGPQGAVTHIERLVTNIAGLSTSNYYYDNATTPNPVTQCTGDQYSYGSSGSWVTGAIANTDPHNGSANNLESRDTLYFEAPGRSVAVAQNHQRQIASPLAIAANAFTH